MNERMIKVAQMVVSLGDPVLAGKYIADIIGFLMSRVSPNNRVNLINNLRNRLHNINVFDVAGKQLTEGTTIGQSLSFVKNILAGQDPAYIRSVIFNILLSLR